MNIDKLRLRVKITIVVGLLSLILFLLHFLLAEFAFLRLPNPAGKNSLNFKMIGLYTSLVFTGVMAGFTYYILGYIYRIFLQAAREIQNLDSDNDDENDDSEETSFFRTVKRSLLQAHTATSFQIEATQNEWEENKSMLINRLMPEVELSKIYGWDISVFPGAMRNANSDYIKIIKTKDGFVGILAGFVDTGISESAEKLFIHGICSTFADTELATLNVLSKIEQSLHGLNLVNLKLSVFGIGKEKDKLHFLHFMDMPIFQFSNHGIQVIEGSGDDNWHAEHPHELSIADTIEIGDYLVWGSDRALKEFGLTSFEIMEEFVDYLLDLSPKSSREMLLAIAKKMVAIGKEKHLLHPMDNLSILVFRRTK